MNQINLFLVSRTVQDTYCCSLVMHAVCREPCEAKVIRPKYQGWMDVTFGKVYSCTKMRRRNRLVGCHHMRRAVKAAAGQQRLPDPHMGSLFLAGVLASLGANPAICDMHRV